MATDGTREMLGWLRDDLDELLLAATNLAQEQNTEERAAFLQRAEKAYLNAAFIVAGLREHTPARQAG
jgi:hypothetical protein